MSNVIAPANIDAKALTGKLWWCADNDIEAAEWKADLLSKGALNVEIKETPDRATRDVIITLPLANANSIVGYTIEEEEWLIPDLPQEAPAAPSCIRSSGGSRLTDEEILKIANDPNTPTFLFGSAALSEWNANHRNPHTGACFDSSDWYVVKHMDITGRGRHFRVLSRWVYGLLVPVSHDVPADLAGSTGGAE